MSVNSEITRLQTAHNQLRQRANTFTSSNENVLVSQYTSTVDGRIAAMEDLASQIKGIWVFDFGMGFLEYGLQEWDVYMRDVAFGEMGYSRYFTNTNKIVIYGGKPYVLFMKTVEDYSVSDTEFMECISVFRNMYGENVYKHMYGLVPYEGLQQIIWCEQGGHLPSWDESYLTFLCPFRYILQFDGRVYKQYSDNTYHTIDMQVGQGGNLDKYNFIFIKMVSAQS